MCPTKLFDPLSVRDCVFPNRLFVPPMCIVRSDTNYSYWQYTVGADAIVTDDSVGYYADYAHRGFGGIVQEATAVVPQGRICPRQNWIRLFIYRDLGIWSDDFIPGLKRIVDICHLHGSKIGIQLAHAGRKGACYAPGAAKTRNTMPKEEGGWDLEAPSATAYNDVSDVPKALSMEEVHGIVEAFTAGAKRAVEAGYDFIQIHAAHGFLLHEFLSPISNLREDIYGGSFENRIRIVCEVMKAVREVIPEGMPLFIRISMSDFVEGGWDFDQSCQLVQKLMAEGLMDGVDCSSAGLSPKQQLPAEWDFQLTMASQLKKRTGALVIGVGGVWNAQTASYAVDELQLDAVDIGKATLRHAFNPRCVASELGVERPELPLHLRWASRVPAHAKY